MKEEEVVVGAGGGLKNVVVRITKGVSGRYDPPAAPAVVDQSACMYRPRVQGIVLGQPLQIKNSDQTLHNVHGYKGASTLFNQAEIPGQPPMTKQFTDADQIVKLKCDVHPWMTGYVLVSSHPFFAVTGDDGSFKITGRPGGQLHGRGVARALRRKNCGADRRRQARRDGLSVRFGARESAVRTIVRTRAGRRFRL